jgi:hypothetical protein
LAGLLALNLAEAQNEAVDTIVNAPSQRAQVRDIVADTFPSEDPRGRPSRSFGIFLGKYGLPSTVLLALYGQDEDAASSVLLVLAPKTGAGQYFRPANVLRNTGSVALVAIMAFIALVAQ